MLVGCIGLHTHLARTPSDTWIIVGFGRQSHSPSLTDFTTLRVFWVLEGLPPRIIDTHVLRMQLPERQQHAKKTGSGKREKRTFTTNLQNP